jgi:hypothetical protein
MYYYFILLITIDCNRSKIFELIRSCQWSVDMYQFQSDCVTYQIFFNIRTFQQANTRFRFLDHNSVETSEFVVRLSKYSDIKKKDLLACNPVQLVTSRFQKFFKPVKTGRNMPILTLPKCRLYNFDHLFFSEEHTYRCTLPCILFWVYREFVFVTNSN